MIRGHVLLLAAAFAMISLGASEIHAHPNLSGTWVLDPAASEFGKIMGTEPPRARTDVIRHRDTTLDIHSTIDKKSGRMDLAYTYVLDGTERDVEVSGQKVRYIGTWDEDTLDVVTRARLLVIEIEVRERSVVSPDGRAMTVLRHVKSPLGSGNQVLRFRKQSSTGR